jgi:hypothetical protein
MAVNYGLGTENAGGPSFGFFYNNTANAVTIDETDVYVHISSLREGVIGTGSTTDSFNYTNHGVTLQESSGNIYVWTSGMYLITYTITTSGANNDNLGFIIRQNGSGSIGGTTQTYSRSGDNFETGSSVVRYLENNDYIGIYVTNFTDIADVTIENINISIVKLKLGGRRPLT